MSVTSASSGYSEQTVESALGKLHVHVGGTPDGPPVLFWPSLLMDGSMWFGVAGALASRYRIVLIDPPGHGGSGRLSGTFDFARCAQCLVDVADALGHARVHLVGNSWGAMIGGTFAARHPERIGAAVLMNGTASSCGWRQRLEYRSLILLARCLGGIRGPLRQRATDAFLGPTTLRERPDVVTAVQAALSRVDIHSMRWVVESVVPSRPDQRVLFGTIRSPVLVVAGAEDATFPLAETRAMADAIPGASFTVMVDAAHLAGLECPDAAAALIDAFLRDHGAPFRE